MSYIMAFVVGGLLCVVFEAFLIFTKMDIPKIFILGVAMGGFLVPSGMSTALTAMGGAGADVMTSGAGTAVTGSTLALIAGNPLPLIILLGTLVILTALGITFGLIKSATSMSDCKPASDAEGN